MNKSNNAVSFTSVVLKKKKKSQFTYIPTEHGKFCKPHESPAGRPTSVSKPKAGKASASEAHGWPTADGGAKPHQSPQLYSQPQVLSTDCTPRPVSSNKLQPLAFGQSSCALVATHSARLKSASVCSSVSSQVISTDGYFAFRGLRTENYQLDEE